MANEFCPRYTMFGIYTGTKFRPADSEEKPVNKVKDEEVLGIYESPWGSADWDDATGSQLNRVYSGANLTDQVAAFIKWYFQFSLSSPDQFRALGRSERVLKPESRGHGRRGIGLASLREDRCFITSGRSTSSIETCAANLRGRIQMCSSSGTQSSRCTNSTTPREDDGRRSGSTTRLSSTMTTTETSRCGGGYYRTHRS